jgi:deoxyribodipyrimidine photo-lyase
VVWFRRDLRLADNPALVEALRAHEAIVPLFVWDPRLANNSGAVRRNFLFGCLEAVNESLDGQLVIRSGDRGGAPKILAPTAYSATPRSPALSK